MSINDRVDDGTFETILSGEGFSALYDPATGKGRYDVWAGEVFRAVPFMVGSRDEFLAKRPLAEAKLRNDAEYTPILAPAVARLSAALAS